mgnify:CR=1 FL=1
MNKYQYKVQGVDYDVEIVDVEGNIAKVNVNGISFEVEMKRPINPATKPHKPKGCCSGSSCCSACCCSGSRQAQG